MIDLLLNDTEWDNTKQQPFKVAHAEVSLSKTLNPKLKDFQNSSQIYSFTFKKSLSNFLKQLVIVVFIKSYADRRKFVVHLLVHLLGTVFSGGLMHIWCASEFLGQQDGACGIQSK